MRQWIVFVWTAMWRLCLLNTLPAQSTIDQTPCECVPVYQCTFKRQHNSSTPIDIRVDSTDCPNLLDVCCSYGDIIVDTYEKPSPLTTPLPPCGRPYLPDPNLRIVGDTEAFYGQYPWMAALLTPERHFICGGSLIHPQVVLTAAHCVLDLQTKVVVRLGEWDSQTKAEPLPLQSRMVSQITAHEQFTPGSLFNDIALLFLDSPVELGGSVGIICLPDANEDMEGRQCLASGWGIDAFGDEGKNAAVLRSVQLTIIPRRECLPALRGTRLGQFFRLHLSFLCAGGEEGKDSCEGDGGGPLVCPTQQGSEVYEQAGIVSWGVNCGQPTPAAYTNVALFRSWIDLQFLRHGLAL